MQWTSLQSSKKSLISIVFTETKRRLQDPTRITRALKMTTTMEMTQTQIQTIIQIASHLPPQTRLHPCRRMLNRRTKRKRRESIQYSVTRKRIRNGFLLSPKEIIDSSSNSSSNCRQTTKTIYPWQCIKRNKIFTVFIFFVCLSILSIYIHLYGLEVATDQLFMLSPI